MADGIDLGKAYVRIEPTAKGIGSQIENVLNNEAQNTGTSLGQKLAGGIGTGLKVGGAAIAAGVAMATKAVVDFGKQAVESYANYEQLVGGVETLYGNAYSSIEEYAAGVGMSLDDAADTWEDYQNRQATVLANADNAYITAGLSANDYMETVNSFAAALNSSLGEYAWQSANFADVAVSDMADNANKMGSSMESIQNAYQGFAKGNFTMLDNLKLGYGGTKGEMERLLREAERLEGYMEGSLSVDNFADIIDAIHIVQENMGITGTTAKEAMFTIEGSAAATKAAWENVITAVGRGEGLDEAFNALIDSVFGGADGGGLLNNIIPRIQTVMEGIGEFVSKATPYIADKLPALIESVVPTLLSSAVVLVEGLAQGIINALPVLIPIAIDVVMQLANAIIDNLPMIISTGVQLIGELIVGISQALPELIPAAVDALLELVDGLLDNIDLLIDAAVQLTIGLAEGLIKAIPVLVEKAPIIISKLVIGLIGAIPQLVIAAGQIITGFANAINNVAPRLQQVGQNLVNGLKNGIINAWNGMVQKVKDMANNLVSAVKGVFGIHSPSKVFAQIGEYCVEGYDEGFSDFGVEAVNDVQSAMDEMSAIQPPTFNAEMTSNMDATKYASASGTTSDLYNLLATYLPLLDKETSVNVSLEGDAQGLFRQIRNQTNQFIKSTGASPFLSPA